MSIDARHTSHFFLGGYDLEMLTLRELLENKSCHFTDHRLQWGASASAYASEIQRARSLGRTPVLVELNYDLEPSLRDSVIEIDHHSSRAGADAPTSLEQVLSLLQIPISDFQSNRWWQLVAANDRGHIRAMRNLTPSASDEEVRAVRLADLQAQGTTEKEIENAKDLLHQTKRYLATGKLMIVQCPSNRTSLTAEVCEPFLGGPGFENLLVIGDTELAFYGAGWIVERLASASPAGGCWFGGSLPEYGFWGGVSALIGFDAVSFIAELLTDTSGLSDTDNDVAFGA